MNNVREGILSTLESGLKTITISNGYAVDVKEVDRTGFAHISTNSPTFIINDNGEDKFIKDIGANRMVDMDIVIEGHLKNIDQPASAVNHMDASLLKYIESADLGDYFIKAFPGEMMLFNGKDEAIFNRIITIRYYYPRSNP